MSNLLFFQHCPHVSATFWAHSGHEETQGWGKLCTIVHLYIRMWQLFGTFIFLVSTNLRSQFCLRSVASNRKALKVAAHTWVHNSQRTQLWYQYCSTPFNDTSRNCVTFLSFGISFMFWFDVNFWIFQSSQECFVASEHTELSSCVLVGRCHQIVWWWSHGDCTLVYFNLCWSDYGSWITKCKLAP